MKTARTMLPVTYLGENWQPQLPLMDQSNEQWTQPATTPAPAATSNGVADLPIPPETQEATLTELGTVALDSEDVSSFMRNVLRLDAVTHNQELMRALTGPDSARYYQELRTRIGEQSAPIDSVP